MALFNHSTNTRSGRGQRYFVFAFAMILLSCDEAEKGTAIFGPGSDYPSCGDRVELFATAPFPIANIRNIEPIGHIFVPGHTFPSDHLYPNIQNGPVDLVAPSDIRIWELDVNTHQYVGGELYTDYSIRFSPCAEVQSYFHHVQTLLDETLRQAVETVADADCTERTYENGEYQKSCKIRVSVDVLEGVAFAQTSTLDYGGYDSRIDALPFVNAARYEEGIQHWDYAHVVCPLDAFEEPVRDALAAKLGIFDGTAVVPRTIAPLCGTVMQDIAGTAQGMWVTQDYEGVWDAPNQVALVRDNNNPANFILATGGGAFGVHQQTFQANGAYTDFADVAYSTEDNAIYCYDISFVSDGASHALLKMMGEALLRFEVSAGACAQSELDFTSTAVDLIR